MILCVDGHDIPILTTTDLTKEQRALFTKPTRVPVVDGHINALLVGSTDKATLVEVKGQTRLDLLVEVGRYRRRCWRSGRTCARTGIGDGRRDAR